MSLDLTGKPFPPDDDRILCTACRAFATKPTELRQDDGSLYTARRGDCLAAATRRRLDVWQGYAPPDVDLPRRCEHFLPLRGAEDQRTGAERYPLLWAEYEACIASQDRVRRDAVRRGIDRGLRALHGVRQ